MSTSSQTLASLDTSPSKNQSRITPRSTTELFGRILLMSLFLLSGLGKIGALAMFLKNLAIASALLMLAANGAGPFSLDARNAK